MATNANNLEKVIATLRTAHATSNGKLRIGQLIDNAVNTPTGVDGPDDMFYMSDDQLAERIIRYATHYIGKL